MSKFIRKTTEQDIYLEFEHSNYVASKRLYPILKWAGGKEQELKYIIPNLPQEKFTEELFIHRFKRINILSMINQKSLLHYIVVLQMEIENYFSKQLKK